MIYHLLQVATVPGVSVRLIIQLSKNTAATIMDEPGDGLHEEQWHGRGYGGEQTSLAFGSGWTALGFIDPSNYNNNKDNIFPLSSIFCIDLYSVIQ